MQIRNRSTFVRSLHLPYVDKDSKERAVVSYTVGSGETIKIPDAHWQQLQKLDQKPGRAKSLWGLEARPDEKLDTSKMKPSEAITKVMQCTDPVAINAALEIETRAGVVAALQVRAEDLGAEASN